MAFKKTEKGIITTIVKYGEEKKTLAEILNESRLLEEKGIAIVPKSPSIHLFFSKEKYDKESVKGLGYIMEFDSLIDTLIKNKDIIILPSYGNPTIVIGRKNAKNAKYIRSNVISLNGNEHITFSLSEFSAQWTNANREQAYWPETISQNDFPMSRFFDSYFSVSQELKELVKHNFRTEEQRRFRTQVCLTWIAIFISIIIGILGIIF